MKTDPRKFNRRRFKALVHYIIYKMGPMDEATLCHILWQCDMTAYGQLGQSITGATYVRGKDYPIPCHL